jgi:hypothetical protein
MLGDNNKDLALKTFFKSKRFHMKIKTQIVQTIVQPNHDSKSKCYLYV